MLRSGNGVVRVIGWVLLSLSTCAIGSGQEEAKNKPADVDMTWGVKIPARDGANEALLQIPESS